MPRLNELCGVKATCVNLRRDSHYTTITQSPEFLKFSFTKDHKKTLLERRMRRKGSVSAGERKAIKALNPTVSNF